MSKPVADKIIPLEEIGNLIKNGDTIALGGMTLYRRPVALVRQIVRSSIRDLTLVAVTCGFESDLLVGNQQVLTVGTTYFGLEFLGLAPCFTKQATERTIVVREETETSLILGLKATAIGTTFMPSRFGQNTELLRTRADVKKVKCPYTGDLFIAWPNLEVDVALFHVNECDELGNSYVSGEIAIDALMAAAAKKVIVSTERIISHEKLVERGCEILGKTVDYIIVAPFGAHPTSLYPHYRVDVPHLIDYVNICREDRFQEYVKQKVLIPEEEYRNRFINERALGF